MGQMIIGDDTKYRKEEGFNNSLLQAYGKGLKSFRDYLGIGLTQEDIDKRNNQPPFRKGSALDAILTQGEEGFKKNFKILPSFDEESAPVILLKAWLGSGNKDWDTEAMEIMSRDLVYTKKDGTQEVGLWRTNKWTSSQKNPEKAAIETATRIKARQDKFNTSLYKDVIFPYLRSFSHKTYITQAEYDSVLLAGSKLRKDLVILSMIEPSEGVDIHTQVAIYKWVELPELKGLVNNSTEAIKVNEEGRVAVRIKVLLDFIKVDHNTKRISPIDLKSTSKLATEDFIDSLIKYGYIDQDSMYSEIVQYWRDAHFPEYEIDDFQFIVAGLGDANEEAMIYQIPSDLRTASKLGGYVTWYSQGVRKSKQLKGWYKTLCDCVLQLDSGDLYLTPHQKKAKLSGKAYVPYFHVTINEQGTVYEDNETTESEVIDADLNIIDFIL